MQRKITTVERQMVKVYSPGWEWCAQGFRPEWMPEKVYALEEYTTDERVDTLLADAKSKWKQNMGLNMAPIVEVFWEEISREVTEIP